MYTEEGNIHLDHALNVSVPSMPSSIERALKKALQSLERACIDISKSITIVGYAAAAYLVMAGVSKLIEARNKRLPPPSQHDDEKQQQNRTINKMKQKKDDDGVKEEWEEKQDW
eukprot:CAMPEP_0201630546 /NCGR_PEP_ID=MMETSP0493-20130528/4839_1 /ASSEMBLY_ACC=CAM_ASM_000838 /TAXON_ID=420259 /ORGANISM="Thalassiosira gravida, Strain GMp14c1" /LENGTH=113 /DNA_ID=CAMNT_0048101735 /DNA_START=58 /DNA_END=396 /DNA_ORIENTATION=+